MLPTPDTSKIDFSNVYEPSEDSFLLLDTLSQASETQFLSDRFAKSPSPLVLEVGSGSGVVLAFIATNAEAILGRPDVLALSTDINTFACRATAQTVGQNLYGSTHDNSTRERDKGGSFLDSVTASLTAPLKKYTVDILVFNPPYVPSENVPQTLSVTSHVDMSSSDRFKRDSLLLALATDGGEDGMEVTDALLSQLSDVLHPHRGVAYVLLCAQNRPEQVKAKIRSWGHSWVIDTVRNSGKQGGWEKLQIIRVARRSGSTGLV